MKVVTRLLVFFVVFVMTASSFAASDPLLQLESGGVFTGDVKPGVPLGTFSGDGSGYPTQSEGMASGTQNLLPIPSGRPTTYLPGGRNLLPGLTSDELRNYSLEQKSPPQKPKVVLKSEAGDGLVSLSWNITGLPLKPNTHVRYTVFYGSESGRYDKKIDVGDATEHRLRELKNNVAYFVRIQGAIKVPNPEDENKERELTVFSNEVKVMPIPDEQRPSLLEKSFAGKVLTLQDKVETDTLKRDVRQFGYEFFRNGMATGVSENAPVGADYVVGPGDSLRIELWGSLQGRYELTVDRNGEIFIPKVGNVKVWGLRYDQARDAISHGISRYFKGYELNVTLGSLRSIQVFVVGEVEMPGTYAVTSVSTVINALSLAGGPTKNGSLRRIGISRNGKTVQEVDLYEMFLAGDRSKDIRLQSGDTIFVPVIGPVAAVVGEVKRPGIYELKGKVVLPELLAMAGGMSAAGDSGRIQVERIEGNSGRIIIDYEPKSPRIDEALAGVEIRDRDMVKVFPVHKAFRMVVTLQGNVARPGEYQFRSGMRIKDLIPGFDALLPDSYLQSAELVRLVSPDFHKEPVSFNLKNAIEGMEKDNILLQEQDTVRVFSRAEIGEKPTVSVNGLVINPGTYEFFPQMTVRDLVTAAGSVKRNAYLQNAELTRVTVSNGAATIERKNFDLAKALAGDPKNNLVLHQDDSVVVRGIEEWAESVDRFVVLKGEVKFPGIYSITKGERLSSVIARAGGFTKKAFLDGARFIRKSVKENQQKRMDEVVERAEQDILKKQGELSSLASSKEELEATKAALEGLMKSVEKLKTIKAEGRIVIHLAALNELQTSPYDLEMMGGDFLEIPQTPSVVNIMGQVYNPTSFVYMPGGKISYYLKNAGGPTREAEEDDMYIIKADGSVSSRHMSSFGITWDEASRSWAFGSFMSRSLQPGDTLVVPQKIERTAWLRDIKDITTILSQVALTAGTVLIGLR